MPNQRQVEVYIVLLASLLFYVLSMEKIQYGRITKPSSNNLTISDPIEIVNFLVLSVFSHLLLGEKARERKPQVQFLLAHRSILTPWNAQITNFTDTFLYWGLVELSDDLCDTSTLVLIKHFF